MAEKPIIFNTQSVQGILAGDKTQTRRLSGLKEINKNPDEWELLSCYNNTFTFLCRGNVQRIVHPRYQIRDIVWVKETYTWVTLAEKDPWKDRAIADGSFRRTDEGEPVKMCYKADGYEIGAPWISSMFMPRWASRLKLKITGVKAERLHQLSFEDCLKEGIVQSKEWLEMSEGDNFKPPEPLDPNDLSNEGADKEIDRGWEAFTVQSFARLWDSINGKKHPWNNNYFVFVYSFERLNNGK